MYNYTVGWEKDGSGLAVIGEFSPYTKIIEIPHADPDRKEFVDLFLHKADIDIGLSYLSRILPENELTINECLFIVALNSCMKCFKKSHSREKLEKTEVFSSNAAQLEQFMQYEIMRDKHYMHDENGMFQTLAFFFFTQKSSSVRFDTPSVVWNRAKLNYIEEGEKLTSIMHHIVRYLADRIDCVGENILRRCAKLSPEELKRLEVCDMAKASIDTPRNVNEKTGNRLSVRFISTKQ